MAQHGKRYDGARTSIDREKIYSPVEAVRLLKSGQAAKFDETVEVHMNLGLNVRHAEEQLRGTMMLPHGTGREQRVAVFAEGDKAREAEEAGADVVGSADLAKRVEEGFTDFDVAIATPDQMGNVGKLGRVLGPRGLMPNPKTGTVTMDVAKAVREAKAGKLEYRTDRGANVHIPIGKRSLRRARAGRELRGADRRDRPCQAVGREGPLHQEDHRSRARWAPASTSTRRRPVRSSKSWRRQRPSFAFIQARAEDRWRFPEGSGRPSEAGRIRSGTSRLMRLVERRADLSSGRCVCTETRRNGWSAS